MLYTRTPPRFPETIKVRGFDVPIPLPQKPPAKEFRNYGLPVEKQKFQYENIPKDVMKWEPLKRDKFVSEQWHKRWNGEWWLIKGHEVYLTGTAWFFFNYWTLKEGGRPQFRMEAVEWFLVWDYVVNNPKCLGMLCIKPRRAGETTKAQCAGYDLATKYRHSEFGSQAYNDESAETNYIRIVEANKRMAPWFKPINLGSDAPKGELVFKIPPRHVTRKSLRTDSDDDGTTQEEAEQELDSKISYRATVVRSYDGQALRFYHFDEIGKVLPRNMDVSQQWAVARLCLTKYNESVVVGKAAVTSSVENLAGGATIVTCRDMWKASDPFDLDGNGMTRTGLVRYFRDYVHSWRPDEWGFHDAEAAQKDRDAKIAALLKAGDFDGAAELKRRLPASIEEALATPEKDCILYPHLLDMQMKELEEHKKRNRMAADNGEKAQYPEAIRGDFVWTNGFKSKVKFMASDTGKFWVSGHPDIPNNWRTESGFLAPGNTGQFTMGVDPVDHRRPTRKGGSDFAISVYAVWDETRENALEWIDGEHGMEIANKWAMRTRRFVCTYSNRPMRPDEAYEDCLKCAMYYGVPAFIERDKPGVLKYFEDYRMHAFLEWKSRDMKSRYGARESDAGAKQTGELIQQWLDELKMHISGYSETYVHLHQLNVFRNYTGDNPEDCDQVISSGMALLSARKYQRRVMVAKEEEAGLAFPFRTFETNVAYQYN